ncbi:DUF5685 family protein [Andreesenia angusta]|uniref:DUF5685 family protein n=1 Tax=Andreesenia angusta TaxID=39480 RepID=UPI001FDEA6C2|nr:DUF5685 family protein [Andreesenia angusta]
MKYRKYRLKREECENLFGYITPYKPELKMREYDVFRGYYCGLCKSMGRNYSQLSRLGLNYDLAFLGIVLSSLEEEPDRFAREGCISNPLKKKPVALENRALEYTADLSMALIHHKLRDDWRDEKSFKSLFADIPFALAFRKSAFKHPEKHRAIAESLERLSALESESCKVVDEAADTFGKLMEAIATPEYIEDEGVKRALGFMGYNLGRWIYILDAFEDMENDLKENSYNPLLLQYEYSEDETLEEFKSRIVERVEFSLTFTLDNVSKSLEVLELYRNREIVENIVYMGMRFKMERILGKKGDEKS